MSFVRIFIIVCITLQFCIGSIGLAQCTNVWIRDSDTLYTPTNWMGSENVDPSIFENVIKKLKNFKIVGQFRIQLIQELDSLKKEKANEDIIDQIVFIENELKSQFQIIPFENYEIALYRIDTLLIFNQQIVVYKFSSTFSTHWHEHNCNWVFNFTSKFGIVEGYKDMCESGEFYIFRLIDNCFIQKKDKIYLELINQLHSKH